MNEESTKEWQDTIKEYQESEKNENSLLRNTKSFRRIRQGYVREKGDTITHTFTKKNYKS